MALLSTVLGDKQTLLPLRDALDNLRLLAFEGEYRAAPQEGSMGNQTGDLLAALSIPREGGGNDSQKCVKYWRSLQGDISGVYPVADRRGRVSHTERERVSIRLRLSVSLPLKKVRSGGGGRGAGGGTHTDIAVRVGSDDRCRPCIRLESHATDPRNRGIVKGSALRRTPRVIRT